MKTHSAKMIPLLGKVSLTSAAVATGLLSPLALAAPGDLDPAFADVGRLGPILDGPAWALETLDDGTVLLAGGDLDPYCDYYNNWYCFYYQYYEGYQATNFVSMFAATGEAYPGFDALLLDDMQVLDIVRQPTGEIVAVGRKVSQNSKASLLTAYRLQADGSLDTTFGTDGIFELPVATYSADHFGTSTVLDPDGRIVIAGLRSTQLIVLRLLPNGSIDDSFGSSGLFAGPENLDESGADTKILRTADGGYRVSTTNAAGCQVIALTASGTMDDAFGTSGISTVDAPSGASTSCNSIVLQPDGRLLVTGNASGNGFAARLLADGHADAGFVASAVPDAMARATALAIGDDGSIAVANAGANGASILRLQADGSLDTTFGNAGSTQVDLSSAGGIAPVVRELSVRADGSVIAAGGIDNPGQAFVVRLLGSAGGDSPGVLGVAHQSGVTTAEDANEVVVNVRRSGGDFGSVSVAYQTADGISGTATVGQDYSEVSGRLFWDDGDRTDREVRIPILADTRTEEPEAFALMLSDAQGGAGLAMRSAAINISADGSPHGQFSIDWSDVWVTEGDTLELPVSRYYYNGGAVSVTLTPVGETATGGDDFVPDPITLTWGDGEGDYKWARISIRNDTDHEPIETFKVELSNATGGALIGPRSSANVTIDASDRPAAQPKTGGGGAWGFLSLLLLGGFRLLCAALSAVRSRRT